MAEPRLKNSSAWVHGPRNLLLRARLTYAPHRFMDADERRHRQCTLRPTIVQSTACAMGQLLCSTKCRCSTRQHTTRTLGRAQEPGVRNVFHASSNEVPHSRLQRPFTKHQREPIRRCTLHTPMECAKIPCSSTSSAPLRTTDPTNSFVGRR